MLVKISLVGSSFRASLDLADPASYDFVFWFVPRRQTGFVEIGSIKAAVVVGRP